MRGILAYVLLALLALVVAGGMVMRARQRRYRVSYTVGPTVPATIGATLLEISRINNVPHTAVCGGRARCSTCRVRIDKTAADLPPRTPAEAATLKRIHAADDVRLACQLRPHGDLTVTRLVQPPEAQRAPSLSDPDEAGVERTLAILFLDIRGFTGLSEARLPYDTVFLLNRFFTETGGATKAAGGWVDKYLGDGLMALFGMNQTSAEACRAALSAVVGIDAALQRLNDELSGEIPAPLRIGIGLHVGPLVIGRIGHPASATTTVIGPAVNVASRLESLTKEHGVQIIASTALCELAGIPPDAFARMDVAVRGASEPVSVTLIPRGQDLVEALKIGSGQPPEQS
jgi:adenylate cyclase